MPVFIKIKLRGTIFLEKRYLLPYLPISLLFGLNTCYAGISYVGIIYTEISNQTKNESVLNFYSRIIFAYPSYQVVVFFILKWSVVVIICINALKDNQLFLWWLLLTWKPRLYYQYLENQDSLQGSLFHLATSKGGCFNPR